MLNLEAGEDFRENQHLVFNSAKPGRKQNKQIKTRMLPKLQKCYSILVPYLLQFSVAKSPQCLAALINYISHASHLLEYLLQLTIIHIHVFEFFSTSDKPLEQVKIITILLLVSWWAYYKTRNTGTRNNGTRITGGTAEHPGALA